MYATNIYFYFYDIFVAEIDGLMRRKGLHKVTSCTHFWIRIRPFLQELSICPGMITDEPLNDICSYCSNGSHIPGPSAYTHAKQQTAKHYTSKRGRRSNSEKLALAAGQADSVVNADKSIKSNKHKSTERSFSDSINNNSINDTPGTSNNCKSTCNLSSNSISNSPGSSKNRKSTNKLISNSLSNSSGASKNRKNTGNGASNSISNSSDTSNNRKTTGNVPSISINNSSGTPDTCINTGSSPSNAVNNSCRTGTSIVQRDITVQSTDKRFSGNTRASVSSSSKCATSSITASTSTSDISSTTYACSPSTTNIIVIASKSNTQTSSISSVSPRSIGSVSPCLNSAKTVVASTHASSSSLGYVSPPKSGLKLVANSVPSANQSNTTLLTSCTQNVASVSTTTSRNVFTVFSDSVVLPSSLSILGNAHVNSASNIVLGTLPSNDLNSNTNQLVLTCTVPNLLSSAVAVVPISSSNSNKKLSSNSANALFNQTGVFYHLPSLIYILLFNQVFIIYFN